MEAELIIKIVIGLIIVLAVLMFLLFLEPGEDKHKEQSVQKESVQEVQVQPQEPPKEVEEEEEPSDKVDLDSLVEIIKNRRSNSQKLTEALELIIKYYGKVHKKLGLRPHPDFDVYIDILFTICRHPNANKDMIIDFDRELAKLNPEYKREINEAIAKGLNSRGI